MSWLARWYSLKPGSMRFFVAAGCAVLIVTRISAAESPREHLLLDANWKFHLGDDWPGALHLDKAGVAGGPASDKLFSDVTWRTVNLPHDWAVELPFDRAADASHGFKPVGPGYDKTSIGWYRRTFDLPASDSGKRIWLTFDGVFRDATVWVNGWLVKRHEGGYYPFREDITDVVHFGGRNLVAVRVDATKFEGWFYEGAGIYRHVWLDKTAPVAIGPDGVFVYSKFEKNVPSEQAEISVEASLLNSLPNPATAVVSCEVVSPEGETVARFKNSAELARESQSMVTFSSKLSSPVLWSPESPKLYKLLTTVSVADKTVDQTEIMFGIRTVGFDTKNGFLLNGKPYELYGTCNHQDHAGVGSALPDALQEFRVKKLKEFGCNAIRTAHNPPTPELLDACDRLGMLVMDESRLLGSDSENLRKWNDQIRRDRNHPCVAIWSIANEEFAVQDSPQGTAVANTMQNLAKHLDPTRPVTYAAPEGDNFWGINSVIEVRGWNYHPGPDMDKYHAEHPIQPNVGTEQASTTCTRGIYEMNTARGYVPAYDHTPSQWAQSAESWWSWFADRPWLSGGFVWTGFDYRGEPTPYGWPCINSHFGILDTCGFPKDDFYYYQSWWTTKPVLHLLPHWNWPGKEGQVIRVDAYSNCKQVELFLNGTSLGRQDMKPNSKLTWNVNYAPGTLSAKGFDSNGNVVADAEEETVGEPVRIQLTPDRESINADGEDAAVFAVAVLDRQGRFVPTAQNKIDFALEGPGKIVGVGNGDPSSHEPDVFIQDVPVNTIPVNDWRWTLLKISEDDTVSPECAKDFNDSDWKILKPKASGNESTIKTENTTAIYRAHFLLSDQDLSNPELQIHFTGCDDDGWYFVNGQFVGESHDWSAQPTFDIKKFLHAGDNVVAVKVKNSFGEGGLNPNVTVEMIGKASVPPWSRSLFNGWAEIIVQSTREAGEFKLTATSEGLAPASAFVHMRSCPPRPYVP
ncbi:MAG TPA: beta-galactosidase GalA [Pirellulales bacterium]|nr:beta-galactosidase GalA [Pirellulales bacterium]